MLVHLVTFLFFFLAFSSPSPKDHYQEGLQALENEEFDQAHQDFEALLKTYPNDPTLLYNQGLTAFYKGEVGPALGLWRKAQSLGDRSEDLQQAIQFAEEGLGLSSQYGSSMQQKLYRRLSSLPLSLWLSMTLILTGLVGWSAIIHYAKQKKTFFYWPLGLQMLIPLWLILISFTIYLTWEASQIKATIAADDSYLFSRPSSTSPQLKAISPGEWVYVEKSVEDWSQIRTQRGERGWLPNEHIITHGGI